MNKLIKSENHLVSEELNGFKIYTTKSTNVEFFGTKETKEEKQIFIQFKSGSVYVFRNVDEDVLKDIIEAESLGAFVKARLTRFKFDIHPNRLVHSK